jgi:hypothetical protein
MSSDEDEHRVRKREEQIRLGKNTRGYENYLRRVPRYGTLSAKHTPQGATPRRRPTDAGRAPGNAQAPVDARRLGLAARIAQV